MSIDDSQKTLTEEATTSLSAQSVLKSELGCETVKRSPLRSS